MLRWESLVSHSTEAKRPPMMVEQNSESFATRLFARCEFRWGPKLEFEKLYFRFVNGRGFHVKHLKPTDSTMSRK